MKPWLKHSMRLSTALMLAFSVVNAQAAEEDDESDEEDEDVEEMVVTGSYIRRDNFDLPSPRDIVDAVDLSLSGTSDLGDIVFDQTFQIGVNAQTATTEFHGADDQQFQQGAETWANLRGLGTRATMTMMDGHRVPASVTGIGSSTRRAGSDLNNMYPGIAIGRIETILDGASALYGASAVSGVINLVPRKDFDGLMVNYEYSQPIENGTPAKRMGLLAGAQGDRTSIIFALEIRDQARMKQTGPTGLRHQLGELDGAIPAPVSGTSLGASRRVPDPAPRLERRTVAERLGGRDLVSTARRPALGLGQHRRLAGGTLLADPQRSIELDSRSRSGWRRLLAGL